MISFRPTTNPTYYLLNHKASVRIIVDNDLH